MRLLLTEDDDLLSETLVTALQSNGYIVDLAKDGQESLDYCNVSDYDLVILDISLPKLTGVEVCRRLRAEGKTFPILLLSAKDADDDKVVGLDAGADDYVIKPCTIPELLARVRALLRRGTTSASPVLTWGELELDPSSCQVTYQGQLLRLSPKEYSLLELLMRSPDRAFSKDAIIDHLWSLADIPTEDTIRAHIKGLRRKLKQAGIKEIIETVYGIGYRLKTAPPPATPSPPDDQNLLAAVAQVWAKNKGKVLARLEIIEDAIARLGQNQLSPTVRQEAINEAHKLAGSLGMYGLPSGSKLARSIEQELEKLDQLPLQLTFNFLRLQVKELRKLFEQVSGTTPDVTPDAASVLAGQRLWLISDHQGLQQSLGAIASLWNFQLQVQPFPLPPDLTVTTPALILFELVDPVADSLQHLEQLKIQFPESPIFVLSQHRQLDERLAVTRLGGAGFLGTDLPPTQIFEAVTDFLRPHPEAKILAVDDDPLILEALQRYLFPWGIALYPLDDPSQFWQTLEKLQPDLLLLDVAMPKINGIELCQIVRRDRAWQHLPIIFLSAYRDSQIIQQIYEAGADDYISKPIREPELITRIFNRLERTRLLNYNQNRDPLIGLLNRYHAQQTLQQSLQQAKEQHQPLCLMMIRLQELSKINTQYGYDTGDRVLQRLGQLLTQIFQTQDTIARWSGAKFLVWLRNCTQAQGQQYLEQLQQSVAQEVFFGVGRIPLQISIQTRLVTFPEAGQDLQSLCQQVESRL